MSKTRFVQHAKQENIVLMGSHSIYVQLVHSVLQEPPLHKLVQVMDIALEVWGLVTRNVQVTIKLSIPAIQGAQVAVRNSNQMQNIQLVKVNVQRVNMSKTRFVQLAKQEPIVLMA